MNQLKFMGATSNEGVHAEGHTKIGAYKLNQGAGFNWAYLMFNWGFPPEIEKTDWLEFKNAVSVFQDAGIKVFGYIQTSNCVFDGSFKSKDWYAEDLRGKKIHYYTGRYMTCWTHPEWRLHLEDMVRGVIESGANGVFFDNPWMGIQPIHFMGTWFGPGGCYCNRCHAAYYESTNLVIPEQINPVLDENSRKYLDWRSQVVIQTIASLGEYARSMNENILVSVNDYNVIMNPSFVTHGIDLRELAAVQDVVMIEDFALPRWDRNKNFKGAELVNNAITLRSALSLVGDTPLTTDPYDKGIGFDDVYSSRRFQQGIAEAAACGVPMVVKGTEFVDRKGVFTLLTADIYAPQRTAIKQIHDWLALNSHLYQDRHNLAKVGLVFPETGFKYNWDHNAPLYFGICQTLIFAGIPWRVVADENDHNGLEIVFIFERNKIEKSGIRVIDAHQLPGWSSGKMNNMLNNPFLRELSSVVLNGYYRAYFENPLIRRLTDRSGITQWFIGSPHFKIPPQIMRKSILDQAGSIPYPRVAWTNAPVLIEVWQHEDEKQCHVVNYSESPQPVTINFGESVAGKILSLDNSETDFFGSQVEMELDIYNIIRYQSM